MTPLGWNVLFFGTYEPDLRALMSRRLPSGGVAIDVGANVGWHTLLMSRLVGRHGRVLALEPNPSIRGRLADHLGMNQIENVTVLPFAAAASETRSRFCGPRADDPRAGSGHLLAGEGPEASDSYFVATRTLDSVVEELRLDRVDAIKIDVEGFEWPVLCGADASIARFRPHVFFEHNREYLVRGGGREEDLESYFQRHRYRVSRLARGRPRPVVAEAWPNCADLWAAPEP